MCQRVQVNLKLVPRFLVWEVDGQQRKGIQEEE